MNLGQLRVYFDTSPAVRLLRSKNAPFIAYFLDQQFKAAGRLAIGHADLGAALRVFRETIQETHPDALQDRPETYLSSWCSSDTRWLHRFLEAGREEPAYQLTPHTEDVLAFLDHALQQDLGFVGTDSRLRMVIETLADLVVYASDDPQQRLTHLRSEKQRIEQEIRRIEEAGEVSRYQPAQIRERFVTAVSLLKQLQGDFRAVEEEFKQITQQVQQRQTEGRDSRGGILEFALESEDVLKREDQGVSFYEFVNFILSPQQQERLQGIIQELGRLQELANHSEGMETVRRMVPLLLAEAEKVMRTNQRLSSTLRRLLDRTAYRERQRVSGLLREIRQLAISVAEEPPHEVGVEVETALDIASPFARTFWSEPQRFAALELTEHVSDEAQRAEAFRALAEMQRLDWRCMRGRVQEMIASRGTATLAELLSEYPPAAGVVEVLAYVQIARDDGHLIDPDAIEQLVLADETGRKVEIEMPLIRFVTPQGDR